MARRSYTRLQNGEKTNERVPNTSENTIMIGHLLLCHCGLTYRYSPKLVQHMKRCHEIIIQCPIPWCFYAATENEVSKHSQNPDHRSPDQLKKYYCHPRLDSSHSGIARISEAYEAEMLKENVKTFGILELTKFLNPETGKYKGGAGSLLIA